MAKKTQNADDPITIKKYANRRLYNTATSSYVTLEQLSQLVKDGQKFVVYDAKTGEDITRSVLTQIIFDEESRGHNMLPTDFLRQLISFYGDTLQSALPAYLEMSMNAFARNQEKMRDSMGKLGSSTMQPFEELARQNLAMFEQAFNMFSPFGKTGEETAAEKAKKAYTDAANEQIDALKRQMDLMQQQLNKLAGGGDKGE